MDAPNGTGGGSPPSWPVPTEGFVLHQQPAASSERSKRRGRENEGSETGKVSNFASRHEQSTLVSSHIFISFAGSTSILLSGRLVRWMTHEEQVTLFQRLQQRVLAILGSGAEIPKDTMRNFYIDFLRTPLTLIQERFPASPQTPELAAQCTQLIASIGIDEEIGLFERIQQFLDRVDTIFPIPMSIQTLDSSQSRK